MRKRIQKILVVLLAVVMSVTFLIPECKAMAGEKSVAEGFNEFNEWSPTLKELQSNAQPIDLLKDYQAKLTPGAICCFKLKFNKKGNYKITYNSDDLHGYTKFYLFDKKLVRHDSDIYMWTPNDRHYLKRIFRAEDYYFVFRSKDGTGTIDFKIEYDTIPKLTNTDMVLMKGKKKRLFVKGSVEYPTWASDSSSVVSIATKGVGSVEVTARKYGTTDITAQVDGKELKCKVHVVDPKINKTSLKLKVKKSYQLKVTQGMGRVAWRSSKNSVARVMNGKVIAKKKGTTYITARCNGKVMKCKVTVK